MHTFKLIVKNDSYIGIILSMLKSLDFVEIQEIENERISFAELSTNELYKMSYPSLQEDWGGEEYEIWNTYLTENE